MNSYQHLQLLLRYDRTFALRSAIFENVPEGGEILDAGTGLGLLAQWAVMAGASKVTSVDFAAVPLARKLAEENGVADRIEFIEADLNTPGLLDGRRFDMITAMIYLNDPRRDHQQIDLSYRLRDNYLRKGGVMCPDKVIYEVALADWPAEDYQSKIHVVEADIANLEGRYGMTFQALRDRIFSLPGKELFPNRGADGRLRNDGLTLLSKPVCALEIDYEGARPSYPECIEIQINAEGRANTLIWTQKLMFRDQLIFSNDSVSWLADPAIVRKGEKRIVGLGQNWMDKNVATWS